MSHVVLDKLWEITRATFGGAPAVLLVNCLQIALFLWFTAEIASAAREKARYRNQEAVLKIWSARRAEIWRDRVRPAVITLMLIGPGLGLALSTLVGALGMGQLGDAMRSQIDQQ